MRPSVASLVVFGISPITAISCDSNLVREIKKYANPTNFCRITKEKWQHSSKPPNAVKDILAACACLTISSSTTTSTKPHCSSVFPSSSNTHPVSSASVGINNSDGGSSSSSSSAIAIIKPSTLSTLSSAATPSTTTSSATSIRTVTNAVANGNFAFYDADKNGGIAGWLSSGCELVQAYGYQGDGSRDTGAVQMIAGSVIATAQRNKRDDQTAMIEQYLSSIDASSSYTVRFFYTILSNTVENTCRMEAYYGDIRLVTSDYFPIVTGAALGNTPWIELVNEAALSTADGYIRFQLTCIGGGYAKVYIDEVFVSNQVTVDNVDNISLLYLATASITGSPIATLSGNSGLTTSSAAETNSASFTKSESSWPLITATTSSSISSSFISSSSPISSSTSSSAASSTLSMSGSSPTLCAASPSSTSGLTCGRYIYNPSTAYKTIQVPDITVAQCGAACLADSNCLSFVYFASGSACGQICQLQTRSVANMGYSYGSAGNGFDQAYDRACFAPTTCATPAVGSVCVDMTDSNSGSSCAAFPGAAKACASPFATATVSGSCGSSACRKLCAQYPSCQSFSYSYAGGVVCRFYSEVSSNVANAGSASGLTYFEDRSCSQCGIGSSVFDWLTPLADPSIMPDLGACVATTPSSSSSSSTSSTSSTSSNIYATSITSSASAFTYSGTDASVSSATSTSTSTTSSVSTACTTTCAVVMPTPTGWTCASRGSVTLQDAYSVSTTLRQRSITDCATICAGDPQCKASGFNVNSGGYNACVFVHTTLAQAGFVASSSSDIYWSDMACDKCGCTPSSSSSSSSNSYSSTSSLVLTLTGVGTSATSTTSFSSTTVSSSVSACTSCIIAVPPPTGVTCAGQGRVSNSNPYTLDYSYGGQNSLMECAAICNKVSGCRAYALDTYYVGCKFLNVNLATAGFVADSSSTVYWSDMMCAACGTGCSSSSSGQIAAATPSSIVSTVPTISALVTNSVVTTSVPVSITTSATSTVSSAACTAGGCTYVTPASPGSTCIRRGTVTGTVYTYSRSQNPAQNSLLECATLCAQDSACLAYGLDGYNIICQLLHSNLAGSGFVADSSSTAYWSDLACTDCSCSLSSSSISTSTSYLTSSTTFSTSTTTTTSTTSASPMASTTCTVPTAYLSDSLTCGLPGSNGNQATAEQNYVISPAGSLVTCAGRCLAHADCLSFRYSTMDTACYLFTTSTANDGLTYSSSSTSRYYDRGCFVC